MKRNRFATIILLIVPFLAIIGLCLVKARWAPFWAGVNSDPDYAYLFNALKVLHRHGPDHFDHPGTTLQLLGALIIGARYLFIAASGRAHSGMDVSVLGDPEGYLQAISWVAVALFCTSLFLSGRALFRMRNLGTGVLFQFFVLCFTSVWVSVPRVAPEALLIPLCMAYVLVLEQILIDQKKPKWLPYALGAIAGCAMASKVTFLPALVLLFVVPGLRFVAGAGLAAALSFVAFTFPIASHYDQFYSWISNVASHQQRYGAGEKGLPTLDMSAENLQSLWSGEPAFFVGTALSCLLLCVLLFVGKAAPRRRALALAVMAVLGQTIITVKHPGVHYLLPGIILICWILATHAEFLPRLAFALSMIGLVLAGGRNLSIRYRAMGEYDAEVNKTIAYLAQQKDCAIIPHYFSSSKVYAVHFGNIYTANSFSQTLDRLYPNQLMYDIWSDAFYDFHGPVAKPTTPPCIIVHGRSLTKDMKVKALGAFRVEKEFSHEIIYRLESNSGGEGIGK